ncbi:MAG: hypothetical protein WDO56_36075 [Gammaproteobacteria bacterium]
MSTTRRISRIFHAPPSLTKRLRNVATSPPAFFLIGFSEHAELDAARERLVAAG